MANNHTSTAAAFQQLGPVDDSFAGAVTQGFQVGRQIRKDREAEEAAKALARQKRSAAAEKTARDMGLTDPIHIKSTGFETQDGIISNFVQLSADKQYDLAQEVRNNPSIVNTREFVRRRQNLDNSVKLVREAKDMLVKNYGTFSEALRKGEVSNWNADKIAGQYDAINGIVDKETGVVSARFGIGYNSENQAILKTVDEDGNVSYQNLSNISTGQSEMFQYIKPFDFEKETGTVARGLGSRKNVSETDGVTIQFQTFESHRVQVEGDADKILGSPEKLSAIGKSIWSDHMNQPAELYTPEKFEEIKNTYVNSIKSQYDTSRSRTEDAGVGGDKTPRGANTLEMNTSTKGDPSLTTLIGVSGDISGNAISFSLGKVATFNTGRKDIKIDTVFMTQDGSIVVAGLKYKKSGGTIDPTTFEPVEGDDYHVFKAGGADKEEVRKLNNFARQVYSPDLGRKLVNAKELSDLLKSKSPEGFLNEAKSQGGVKVPKTATPKDVENYMNRYGVPKEEAKRRIAKSGIKLEESK